MSISLPYVPNLTLGCIIDPPSMDRLMAMSSAMGIIDAAQDHLNAQISMKRSLEMTAQELSSMNVDTAMLIDKMRAVDASIDAAANNYAKVRVEQELALQPLRAKSGMVNASYESPVNWVRSELLPLDLGADTIKLNVQYFSFDQNVESTQNQLNNIRSFVSGSAHLLGLQVSGEMASAAVNQVNSQLQSHSIEGTLIVTATCTHRDVTMFAPLILDVDKAIRVWNQIHPDPQSRIVTNDWVMAEILEEEGTEKEMEKAIHIVSGAAFGSSFVGMVHLLRTETTDSSQTTSNSMTSGQIQARLRGSAWFQNMQGGMGVEASVVDDIRRLLSRAEVDSHVTLITAGLIPSISSNLINTTVSQFANFDPSAMMKEMAALQNNTNTGFNSLQTAANSAMVGGQMAELKKATIKSVIGSVSKIDAESNKVINIASMLTAFENYIGSSQSGKPDQKQRFTGSLPVQYFIKPITRSQLARLWVNKYFPGEFRAIQGDDSKAQVAPKK